MDRFLVNAALACVLILCYTVAPGSAEEEGSVRLTGGNHGLQGILEVYINEQWGTVCKIGWNSKAADIVCKQLGAVGGAMFTESTHTFQSVSNQIHMSEVKCEGTERKLTDCTFNNETTCTDVMHVKMDCVLPGYKACVKYDPNDPPLKGRRHDWPNGDKSIDACTKLCRQDGYHYAGINTDVCICGSAGEDFESFGKVLNGNCSDLCTGDGWQNCGNDNLLAIHEVIVGSCSGSLKGKNGSITSPEFPGSYPHDARTCQWVVDVSDNGDTTIKFPVFNVTDEDAIEITTNGGKSWDKYNMTSIPTSKTFEQKQIIVRFVMEGTTENRAGFVMTFQDDTSCEVVTFQNGKLDVTDGMTYRPGDKVEVICNKTFTSEWKYATCQEDGFWNKPPECLEIIQTGRSLVFTSTLLFMMLAIMGSLGLIFFMVICGVICVGRKKKKEGYTGISRQESAEPTKAENEYHVDMHDGSDVDMQHARGDEDQAIPLATEAMDE